MDKWRPIETAPTDGNSFLAVTSYGLQCVMRFNGCSKTLERTVTCRRCDGMGLGNLVLWHPLPEISTEQLTREEKTDGI